MFRIFGCWPQNVKPHSENSAEAWITENQQSEECSEPGIEHGSSLWPKNTVPVEVNPYNHQQMWFAFVLLTKFTPFCTSTDLKDERLNHEAFYA